MHVTKELAEQLEILNGTDYFDKIGKYAYELTVFDVQTWLRETHGLHVYCYKYRGAWDVSVSDIEKEIELYESDFINQNYNEALAAGIAKAVEIVKERSHA